MGGALPDRGQPVRGFGAAAGYTHPATGFSVAASLRAAPACRGGDRRRRRRPPTCWDGASGRRRCGGPAASTTTAWRCCSASTRTSWRRSSTPSSTCRSTCGRRTCASTATPPAVIRTMTAVLRRLPWAMRRRLRGEPVRRSLIDLRTASTQPTATAIDEDEPLHGVGQVRAVAELGQRRRLRVRRRPRRVRRRSARRTSARASPGSCGASRAMSMRCASVSSPSRRSLSWPRRRCCGSRRRPTISTVARRRRRGGLAERARSRAATSRMRPSSSASA